jgi:hypothetical protein
MDKRKPSQNHHASDRVSECLKALAALDAALAQQDQPVPDGWFTAEDIAQQKGVSIRRAREVGGLMVKQGILESKPWKRRSARFLIFRLLA